MYRNKKYYATVEIANVISKTVVKYDEELRDLEKTINGIEGV